MEERTTLTNDNREIFATKPFAFVLTSKHIDTRCDNCLKSGKLFKCSACEYVSYCGRGCQKQSWPVHKVECPNLKRISPKIIPDTARLMARIIIKLNKGGGDEVGYYTKSNFRRFQNLMSHYSDIMKHETRMEHFSCLCAVLFEYLPDVQMPNTAELMGIYGRICINSFNILDQDMNSIGVGIYLGPSVIDHSCQPNAVVVFDGTKIIIRAIEDQPKLDWTKVRISYIDVLKPTVDRKRELKESYYFDCDCKRCRDPYPEEIAAACPNIACSCPCAADVEYCLKCGAKFPDNFNQLYNEVVEFTKHHLQDMKNMAYLDVSKACLAKQRGVLHALNVYHVKTIEAAFDAAVNLQAWEEAENFAKELLPGYLFYYGKLHPITGVHHMLIGKIQLHLGKVQEALHALKTAESIVEITHGESHSIVRENLHPLLHQAIAEVRRPN